MELPPLRSSRSVPSFFPRRPVRAGRARRYLPPAAGATRGAARFPRHVTPPPPLPAAGTMAARAPRVRGRAALKGAGAGRSRDRGGHPNHAHTHRQRRQSANQLYSAFPPFMIDVQRSRGKGTATAHPRTRAARALQALSAGCRVQLSSSEKEEKQKLSECSWGKKTPELNPCCQGNATRNTKNQG